MFKITHENEFIGDFSQKIIKANKNYYTDLKWKFQEYLFFNLRLSCYVHINLSVINARNCVSIIIQKHIV